MVITDDVVREFVGQAVKLMDPEQSIRRAEVASIQFEFLDESSRCAQADVGNRDRVFSMLDDGIVSPTQKSPTIALKWIAHSSLPAKP